MPEPVTAAKRPSWVRWAVIGVAVIAVLGLVYAGWVWTATPAFCGSCHEMQAMYAGWQQSPHHAAAPKVTCLGCHSDPGFLGELKAHVVDGGHDLYVHVTRNPQSITTTAVVPPSRCLACHDNAFAPGADVLPADHPPKTAYCPNCHASDSHSNLTDRGGG